MKNDKWKMTALLAKANRGLLLDLVVFVLNLFLMQRLMDRVERFNEGGNVVRLTLKRT